MTECKIRLVANEILLRYALPPKEQAVQEALLKQVRIIEILCALSLYSQVLHFPFPFLSRERMNH
jgi:hypothetical protein